MRMWGTLAIRRSEGQDDKERMDQELKQYLDARFAAVDAKIERVETALLTEFHKWASPAEMRARTHAAALRAIDLEMESITEHVEKLEGKKEN
jgi:hypothetical protein